MSAHNSPPLYDACSLQASPSCCCTGRSTPVFQHHSLQVLTYGGIQGMKETRQRSEDIVTLTIEGNAKVSWTRDGNPAVRPSGALAPAGVNDRVDTYVLWDKSANVLADSQVCRQLQL